jgi:L-ascorbate metabolism protein UlaG (beta-lactamase superfamily)
MMVDSMDLRQLTQPAFTATLNAKFQVQSNDGKKLDLTLTSVSANEVSSHNEQFSIVFRGSLDTFLPQGIYQIMHERMGSFDLFLVPIGRNESGYEYEAVFNRMRQST